MATPRWKVSDWKPRPKTRMLSLGGKRVTYRDFRKLPYVHGWEIIEPLAQIDSPPGPWDGYGVVGRDKDGNYVRASVYEWEQTYKVFDELPMCKLEGWRYENDNQCYYASDAPTDVL